MEAEDIADVLEVQAADAEDAQLNEEGNTEGNTEATVKAQAAVDAGHVTGEVTHPLLDGQARQAATGATKDVHEADLDMSHTDSAPGESSHGCVQKLCCACQHAATDC